MAGRVLAKPAARLRGHPRATGESSTDPELWVPPVVGARLRSQESVSAVKPFSGRTLICLFLWRGGLGKVQTRQGGASKGKP